MAAKPPSKPPVKRNRPGSVSKLRKEREQGHDVAGARGKVQLSAANTAIMLGDDDPKDWDDEELLHGRRRDRNGGFQGSDPAVIPKAVQDELVRRTMRKTNERIRRMAEKATDALEDLLTGADVDDKVRIKAVEMVLNRTVGKVPERMEIGVTSAPWEDLVVEAIVDEDIIDVEGEEVA